MALKIDIFGMEFAAGLPNWLSRVVRHGPNIDAIRAKHRDRHLKKQSDLRAAPKQSKYRAALSLLRRRP